MNVNEEYLYVLYNGLGMFFKKTHNFDYFIDITTKNMMVTSTKGAIVLANL